MQLGWSVADVQRKSLPLYYIFWTTMINLLFAIVGLILTFPILFFCAVFIKLDSKGPIFFYQKRVGLNGKQFTIIKLRTMIEAAEKNGQRWASVNDPRVTKVGAILRKYRLDELPQFINVIKGDISLIGPRPEVPELTKRFTEHNSSFIYRLQVKPGITGWAQVNGGYDLSPDQKLKYDMEYINNIGIAMDAKIIVHTIRVLFTGDGAR
ncbi:UDP-phosphate N-acetylgalactosaminyl-1-phosphate transferase [Bacillus sp. V5-8f]|nr:UDP-phosphate N-acetylgalactosaminyl-1-phosphate transferase [Bacillus sp. V5-8f]